MLLRICVVIPCFDNPRTISQVVKDVVMETPYPILIIDDGSETPVANVLYSFEVKQALENGRVRLVRFDKNQGKGAALQYAVQDLVAQGFTHMMTLDGDGRQKASEIKKLVEEGRRHPLDLILGNRGLQTAPDGRVKKWMQKALSASVKFETGSRIQDTGSGFRLYPLFPLQMMKFRTKRYDFELEVLIRLIWNGVRVRELDIAIAPFDSRDHVVHFHRFWDSLRVSGLNLTLLVVSLLKTHNNPGELALAIGLGVFVGCTPAYGFHTVIVLALAVVLRLNFVALWIGTHVSTPLVAPLVFWAEVSIGQHWLGISTNQGVMGHFYQLIAGSLVLGAILGVLLSALTYIVAYSLQRQRDATGGVSPLDSNRLLKGLLRFGGIGIARLWLRMLSLYRYLVWFHARRGLNEYYRVLQPKTPYWPRQGLVLGHLQTLGEVQLDCLAEPRPVVQDDGILEQARKAHPSLTVVSAHIGCWKLCVPSSVNCRFADRISTPQFEILPLLGRLALFDVSAFGQLSSQRTVLVESFGVRTKIGQYQLLTRPPRDLALRPDSAPELQIFERASRFVRQLELMVRKYPDQWFNIYPIFSHLPVIPESALNYTVEDLQATARLRPESSPETH